MSFIERYDGVVTHTYYNTVAAVAAGSGPVASTPWVLGGSVAAEVAAAADLVSRLLTSIIADDVDDDDGTLSVIAFIILYGLVPRNDLGKYCSSTDGVYSGIAVTPVVGVAFAVVSLGRNDADGFSSPASVVSWNSPFPIARFSSVSRFIFIF